MAKEIEALRTQHELSHTSDSFGANSDISACAPSLLVSLGSLKKIAKGQRAFKSFNFAKPPRQSASRHLQT